MRKRGAMLPEIAAVHTASKLIARTSEAVDALIDALPSEDERTRARAVLAAHYPLFMAGPTGSPISKATS